MSNKCSDLRTCSSSPQTPPTPPEGKKKKKKPVNLRLIFPLLPPNQKHHIFSPKVLSTTVYTKPKHVRGLGFISRQELVACGARILQMWNQARGLGFICRQELVTGGAISTNYSSPEHYKRKQRTQRKRKKLQFLAQERKTSNNQNEFSSNAFLLCHHLRHWALLEQRQGDWEALSSSASASL